MPWAEIFVVFVVSHLFGDYLLQTDWQARNKHGGLTGTRTQRLALGSHILTYTLGYAPAFVWLWDSDRGWVFLLAFVIALPHWIQDDGRVLSLYARRVKKADIKAVPSLGAALDQSFHLIALFWTAVLAHAIA